jgi:hypothetical protein
VGAINRALSGHHAGCGTGFEEHAVDEGLATNHQIRTIPYIRGQIDKSNVLPYVVHNIDRRWSYPASDFGIEIGDQGESFVGTCVDERLT